MIAPRNTAVSAPPAIGPLFEFVDQIGWEEFKLQGGFGWQDRPLLVKGAVRTWPAWERWSFERLADLRRPDGSEVVARFITGVTEQGITRDQPRLPIAPYLHSLARSAAFGVPDDSGLLPDRRRRRLGPGDRFRLNWPFVGAIKAGDRLYLQQWNILDEFPALRADFAIRQLWPGLRWTWEYIFIGPAHTVTGLHYDFPNNWFCQVRGTKEVVLCPPDQSRYLCRSRKYDWGATLSDVDITRPGRQEREWAMFEKARGLYARVEAGDALFIPKRTWHAVVALEPSISLGVFGLTPL
ncbi:MAG TPA: cupin-like domain-containing protein, partial [Gemmataceae bacterium]|nr:cupin-like domain-containing protein [Gemmataceae bacterium]